MPGEGRSQMLGGVCYATLESQFEKDVYDIVDSIIHRIEANNDEKADALFVRRILLSQQQESLKGRVSFVEITHFYLALDTFKNKKKRQGQTKATNQGCQSGQSDENTEFEQVQERIKEAV